MKYSNKSFFALKNKSLVILLMAFAFSPPVKASEKEIAAENKVIEANFPADLTSLKGSYSGTPLTLSNHGLRYKFIKADLDGNHRNNYLVILYRAFISSTDTVCRLQVIKYADGSGKTMGATTYGFNDELSGCANIQLYNLTGDGKPTIFVGTLDPSTNPSGYFFFNWNGNNLVDITPTATLQGNTVNGLRMPIVSEIKMGNLSPIIDTPATYYLHGQADGQSVDQSTKVYLVQNQKMNLVGTYDYFQLIDKGSLQSNSSVTFNPTFSAQGAYNLIVKNISNHHRAVRAEVTVNGNIVLKPQDFCSSPQPGKGEKDKWKGNDDNDDKDEDHCKRCVPKQEADAVVTLNVTNTIKIKVYGRQDSKLELTLVKKP